MLLSNLRPELCSVEEPKTCATLMGYDAAGNLAWSASGLSKDTACSTDGSTAAINARKAVRTYDARNRIATLTFPDANGNQSWTYTPDGLPASVTTYNDAGASSVTNSYAYNKRRLLVGESQASGSNTWTVGYGYDGNASLSVLVYPDSLTVAYAPNALGQPTQAGTYATGVTYYPNGAIAGFTYGNGIVHTLTQNARGLPDRSQDMDGSTAIHDDSYDYDPVGNVLAISDAVTGHRGDRDMVYDAVNRLTSATSPMFGTASYTYDAADNLRHVAITGGSQPRDQDYCYDEHWRLTNVKTGGCDGGTTVVGLGYDAQGNLANKSGVLYGFDYGNRLRSGGPETYRYDVQGRRIRSVNGTGQAIYSLYSQSGQLLFQRDERSSKRRQYVYLGGSLVAESDVPLAGGSATVIYQHTDALGSPVATTDASKTVLQRSEYEPYGYLLNRAMEDGPGYTGHATDAATGLVYMQQRYYDPLIGHHFLSVDPVTPNSSGGMFNRYWYANANPYRFSDPSGRDAIFFTDTRTLVYPVYFKGAGAQDSKLIAGIKEHVESLKSADGRIEKIILQVLDKPGGAGTNVMDLSPVKDYRYGDRGEGVYEGVGGRYAHIDSSRSDAAGAATHDINHFGGAPDGYVMQNKDGQEISVNAQGYTDDDIMGRNTAGDTLTAADVDDIISNDTTYKYRQQDFMTK